MGIPLLDLQAEFKAGCLMGRKQLPPQPPPCRGGRKALAHDTFHAGRSYQAVARWATRVLGILPAGTATAPKRGQRGPPIPPIDLSLIHI